MAPLAHPVTVSFEDLKKGTVSLEALHEAFGPDSLGILVVKDVPPEFVSLRHRLLSYSSYLGNLPQSELEKLENEKAMYLTGWSRGRETLKNGQVDRLKGSFYANCAFYTDADPASGTRPPPGFTSVDDFPEYLSPNVWPDEPSTLPGFRGTFEQLCRLVIDVAVLVARACDRFAAREIKDYPTGYLEQVVSTSTTTKARLLHYFPPEDGNEDEIVNGTGNEDEDEDDWCATHLDHGCLTGLTSAMFVDEETAPVVVVGQGQQAGLAPLPELAASPDPAAGLYIKSRAGTTVQVRIPRDCLAFQTGEALERITAGRFKAVPHFVRGARAALAGHVDGEGEGKREGEDEDEGGKTSSSRRRRRRKIARNTLAVFTQPNLGEEVDLERHLTFGDFAREIVARNTVRS